MLGKRKYVSVQKSTKKAKASILARRSKQALANIRREELKTVDTGLVTFASLDATNGNFQLLNGVANNTDFTDRIGRKILMKSLLIRFQYYPLTSTGDANGDVVRLLVLCDGQPNGAAPVITDVLQTASYLAPLNLNNRGRFRIIVDELFTMPSWNMAAGALTTGSPRPTAGKIYKTMTTPVFFSGTGATITSIQTNSLYLAVIPATNASTGFVFNSRVRFTDA